VPDRLPTYRDVTHWRRYRRFFPPGMRCPVEEPGLSQLRSAIAAFLSEQVVHPVRGTQTGR